MKILESLSERAQLVTSAYNDIEGVSLQQVQGAMYAFPRISLPVKAIQAAKVNAYGILLSPTYTHLY